MKVLSVREMREALTRLDDLVAQEGEIVITRHGRPIARVVATQRRRPMPSHANLRSSMPRLRVGSERLVRKDRDER